MPVTESFLATCRTAIELTAQFTAYRTAYALYDAASTAADKAVYWNDCFSDAQLGQSPAMALKKAIRETVLANADATITATERESAYRTLKAYYVGDPAPPLNDAERQKIIEDLLIQAG